MRAQPILLVGYDKMLKKSAAIFLVVVSACATPSLGVSDKQGDFGFEFSYIELNGRPALKILIENRVAHALCVRSEILRNPYSYEINLICLSA